MSPKRLSVFASLMRVTMVFLGALLSVRTLAFHGTEYHKKTQGMVPRGVKVSFLGQCLLLKGVLTHRSHHQTSKSWEFKGPTPRIPRSP